ncbi:ABC transporter substrate-binding protein [Agrilactobacillus composti DSM 18527 = JCM 14202]|uniref:ABC transporter substrate-binding protein n=1 Tax=Agrilactobacillus composti DSM 18527 = JCM 14202 TaxID=1423734 RepID=A0A0R1XSA8_9LACO|nr:tryptophan ABC transporter substrate-binding protein [Agrilactobacillus composti]KRM33022.1 ABC transporter substrate-binding protein [Agrilactobacillus composti DSM 18527 = JCM 14202]
MKRLYASIILVLGFLLVAFFSYHPGNAQSKSNSASTKTPTIGILQSLSQPALDDITKGTVDQLAKRGYKDGKGAHITLLNAQGDQSNLKSMSEKLNDQNPALTIGIATPAAQALANVQKTTPMIMGAISSPIQAGLVTDLKHPGHNITGVSNTNPTNDQLKLIHEIVPNVTELGVIYTAGNVTSQVAVKELQRLAPKYGMTIKPYTIATTNDLDQVSQQMLKEVKAVYIPQDNNIASAMKTLVKNANIAKIPLFPPAGTMVQDGGLATIGINQYDLGVATGNMAADVLDGKSKPATTPVQVIGKGQPYINTTEAKLLGIKIPQHLLDDAKAKGGLVK